ncbi:hypothetical protein CFR80_17765 [Komagataeibacter oboediens]|uniref:Uncharacterized protein n=1 Tax=Komagataeibacter oboediens TaxID=65958 RepID=A0A318QJ69_9PROT|nr:hypothetical protein CFR80_17765 [Komagataeibacter oboediens]
MFGAGLDVVGVAYRVIIHGHFAIIGAISHIPIIIMAHGPIERTISRSLQYFLHLPSGYTLK